MGLQHFVEMSGQKVVWGRYRHVNLWEKIRIDYGGSSCYQEVLK